MPDEYGWLQIGLALLIALLCGVLVWAWHCAERQARSRQRRDDRAQQEQQPEQKAEDERDSLDS